MLAAFGFGPSVTADHHFNMRPIDAIDNVIEQSRARASVEERFRTTQPDTPAPPGDFVSLDVTPSPATVDIAFSSPRSARATPHYTRSTARTLGQNNT